MKMVAITTPYITLGQLLKYTDHASGGGAIKALLEEGLFLVDDEVEIRRGRKVYPGMKVTFPDGSEVRVTDATDQPDA